MDIDGKSLADEWLQLTKQKARNLKCKPGIAFVLVGNDPASQTYVRSKRKKCEEVGFNSQKIELEQRVSQTELFRVIDQLNTDPKIHGILVQMPLPSQLDQNAVIRRVRPEKDVDGFHPINMGRIVLGDLSGPIPCTPHGIIKILEKYDVKTEGAEVVIVGRSNIVGKPLANLLMQKTNPGNATVTLAHSYSHDLPAICRRADILIAAIGKPRLITANMVKEGAVVIDVGINRLDSGDLIGDVDYDNVHTKASLITPVPGGVGPMTIAMLLHNTLECAQKASNC